MFVFEILKEEEFTITRGDTDRRGRSTFNILNPQGQVVGTERTRGAAQARANTLTQNLRTSAPARTPARSTGGQLFDVDNVDGDGKLSGRYADGTEFRNKNIDELADGLDGNAKTRFNRTRSANKQSWVRRIAGRVASAGWWGGLSAILGALQIYVIWEEANDKIAQVYADMESLRLRQEHRQRYYDANMRRINKAKWVATAVTALGSVAEAIAAGATANKVRRLVQAFSMISRLGGPIGWVAGLAVVAISEGLMYLLGYWINNYGEDMANWIVDTMWDGATAAARGAAETVIDGVADVTAARGPQPDEQGARRAMARDQRSDDSGNPSADARRAVNWLD